MNEKPSRVVKELESKPTVTGKLWVTDVFFVIFYMALAFALMGAVHSMLKPFYLLFSLGMSIFLTARSTVNRRRRSYESLFLLIKRDTAVYHSLCIEEERRKLQEDEAYLEE